MPALKKTFEKILAHQSFDQLEPFKKVESWAPMTLEERELLAKLFLMQGETFLREGDSRGLESFSLASRVAPNNPSILYRQALAYANLDHMPGCLEMGCDVLEKLVAVEPNSPDAWELWAKLLIARARLHLDTEFLDDADSFLDQAATLIASDDNLARARIQRLRGQIHAINGRHSGEALDYSQAVRCFEETRDLGLEDRQVDKELADVLAELGSLVARPEMVEEAVALYEKIVQQNPDYYEGWLSKANAFHKLLRSGRTDAFQKANDSFEMAARLRDGDKRLWTSWGSLLLEGGLTYQHIRLLQLAADKFARAYACEPNQSTTLCQWGAVLMHWGSLSEQLPLLRQAEEKILRAVQLAPENAEMWGAYALSLYHLGLYFEDDEHLLRAIEKFEYARTLEPDSPKILHGMAQALLSAGELRGDLVMMEKALDLFNDAVEIDHGRSAQFWSDWGVALMKIGELAHDKTLIEAAVDRFEQALNLQQQAGKNELECLYHYGCALDYMGDFHEDATFYERAIQVLSQVVTLDPHHISAQYNLGLALSHLGEISADTDCFHKALDHFRQVVERDQEDEVAWNDWGLTLLSLAQLMADPSEPSALQELRAQAEEKLLRAVSLGSIQAFYNLACLYSLQGYPEEAMHYLERAEISGALPPLEDLTQDEWLDALRQTDLFQEFLAHLVQGRYSDDEEHR